MSWTRSQLRSALVSTGEKQRSLLAQADQIRRKILGDDVYFRGIIEFSNICEKNCYYCGIRRGNSGVNRYHMSFDEIMKCASFIDSVRYGSVVLQSGEITSPQEKKFLLKIVRAIRKKYPHMGITLSIGEHDPVFLKDLKTAGADRYLLRIETSVPGFYKKIHPSDHSLVRRKKCLRDLRRLGYQVGCGSMIGVPGQTLDDIVSDLMFFQKEDFDMFGLGPYVIHETTPLATPENVRWWKKNRENIFQMSLNFIALLRIQMPTCNIAAATALDVFHENGREQALKSGANVIMPAVTPGRYRHDYLLYQNKPCVDDNAEKCSRCIVQKVRSAGLKPALGVRGTSEHFLNRTKTREPKKQTFSIPLELTLKI